MATIHALPDGLEEKLELLDYLIPLSDSNSQDLTLAKKIEVADIGKYTKKLLTPLYGQQAIKNHLDTIDNINTSSSFCIGVLCNSVKSKPKGYVTRKSGAHCFCLPVYDSNEVSRAWNKIVGYLPANKGFVAVTSKRILPWILLALLAFCLSFLVVLCMQMGFSGASDYIMQWFI